MEQIIYSKYSNERSREFAVRTDILEDGQRRYVKKTALYPEGEAHIQRICQLSELLTKEYENVGLVCNACESTEDGIRLEYLEGQTLEEYLDKLLEQDEIDQAKSRFYDYLEQVRTLYDRDAFVLTDAYKEVFGSEAVPEGLTCADLTNIDMVCSNLLLTEREPVVLDYEWTFAFPVPCQFVLYRIIQYYAGVEEELRQKLEPEQLFKKLGITQEQRAYFKNAEKNFQEYLTRGHVPMRQMFPSMTPGVESAKGILRDEGKIYFFRDGDFHEKDAVSFLIVDKKVVFKTEIPRGCTMVRIDPGNRPCGVYIEEISCDGQKCSLAEAHLPEGVAVGKWAYFANEDPYISHIRIPKEAKELTVAFTLYQGDAELFDRIIEMGQENKRLRMKLAQIPRSFWKLKNTAVWKLYKKCRGEKK